MNLKTDESVAAGSSLANEIPRHIAIIMDGNGRWAQGQGLPRIAGHQKGAERVQGTVEECSRLGVEVLTLFAFSDENWGRPRAEVAALLRLLETYVVRERKRLREANIKLRVIGELDRLPARTRRLVAETEAALAEQSGMVLSIAISYGARAEISSACKKIAQLAAQGEIAIDAIGPQMVADHLWTAGLPDPDLVIRTSGECRISNFLLWQVAYAEFFFTSTFWPDFTIENLREGIASFRRRKRRFGLVDNA